MMTWQRVWAGALVVLALCLTGDVGVHLVRQVTNPSCLRQMHQRVGQMYGVGDPMFAAGSRRHRDFISCDEGRFAAVLYALPPRSRADVEQRLRASGWTPAPGAKGQQPLKVCWDGGEQPGHHCRWKMISADGSLYADFGNYRSVSDRYTYVQVSNWTGGMMQLWR
jgi:hypothetical protein